MALTLELMLFGLATILRRNADKPLVKAKLADRARVVQIRTADRRRRQVLCFRRRRGLFSARSCFEP